VSRDLARRLIATVLVDNWDSDLGPVVYPNQPSLEAESGSLYYQVQILWPATGTDALGIGGRSTRSRGYLYLHGYCSSNTGTSDLNRGLEFFADLFRERVVNVDTTRNIKFLIPNQQTLGYKNGMLRESCLIEFYCDNLID
jgi:hypothetical protein